MAFGHLFSLAKFVALNFGCKRFRIISEVASKHGALQSAVAVQFNWNPSRRLFLVQVVSIDLLFCRGLDLEYDNFS